MKTVLEVLGTIALVVVIAAAGIFGYNQLYATPPSTAPTAQPQTGNCVFPTVYPPGYTIDPLTCQWKELPAGNVEQPALTAGAPSPMPATCTTVVALDPGNGVQWTPSGVPVLLEVVDNNAKSIKFYLFTAATPVKAWINGAVHYNVWYYCDMAVAQSGANSQYQERLSESTQPNSWATGYTVFEPNLSMPDYLAAPAVSATCTTVVALDPGNGVQWTPSGVPVLLEVVDNNAKSIKFYLFTAATPVKAWINGAVHYNVWYYCDMAVAQSGANSQYQERLSESTQPNSWATGYTVYAPVNAPFGQ